MAGTGRGHLSSVGLQHSGAVSLSRVVPVEGAEQDACVDHDHRGGSDVACGLVGEVRPADLFVPLGG